MIGCHSADGLEWVRQEALESLAYWRLALAVAALSRPPRAVQEGASAVEEWLEATVELERRALEAGYRIDRLTSAPVEPRSGVESGEPASGSTPQPSTVKE